MGDLIKHKPLKMIKDYVLLQEDLSRKDLTVLLASLTGSVYVFAHGNSRIWGEDGEVDDKPNGSDGFYQLMPNTDDDGFFHWYCYVRDNEQWFVTKENCALHFIFYWMKWRKMGRPSPF